ncbi:polyamine transporter [Rhexocercosporidium sp. MPI-PUGE-AT-0058]|nr:polyamine transporter [Rhexocercosporidium sp. MPI-PUGE-AT-0058]
MDFVSMRRTPEPHAFIAKDVERRVHDVGADSELVGTIVMGSLDTGRRALRPQPSMDCNDPLNWTGWQKHRTYIIICLFSFLATANSSKIILAASLLGKEFDRSPMAVGYLTCFNVVALGAGNLLWVPLMRVIGKRSILLLALPVFVAANVWSAKTKDFNQLLASCVLSGFASAAAEASVAAVVTDLFFVHERGAKLMIFHFALSSGIFLGPLISAFIIQFSEWRMACESLAIAAGALWAFAAFLFQETTYPNRDVYAPASSYGARTNFAGVLSLGRGYDNRRNILYVLCDCITTISYPSVLWAGLFVATFSASNTIVQLKSYQAFSKAPYSHDTQFLGLFSISGFIGAILAVPVGGKLIDVLSNRVTNSHHGTREPEYRLFALIIPAIVGPMGILLFALTLAENRPWIQPAIGYAMQGFGLTAVSNIVITYVIDTYVDQAAEALTVLFVLKGAIGALVVLYGDDWIRISGEKQAFGQIVGTQYFLCIWVIVFLLWGKKIRAFTVRYGSVRRAGYP